MWTDFSSDFTHKDDTYINLNNGTLGLTPGSILQKQVQYLYDFEKNTTAALTNSWKLFWSLHEDLGHFFNSDPQNFFLRPNVTLVLNELLLGLELSEKDSVVTNDLEYGAINNILKHLSRLKKTTYCELKFSEFLKTPNLTDEELVDFFIQSLPKNARLVMISHVFTGHGLVFPIQKLAKKLNALNIYLVVDGAHGPGLLPLDFKNDLSEVSFYGGNLHKWMMGPKGTAFGWVHPKVQSLLTPPFGSWTTEETTVPVYEKFYPENHFVRQWLWSHSQGFSSFFALKDMFLFWNTQSSEKIRDEINFRMNYLEEKLKQGGVKGALDHSPSLKKAFLAYPLSQFNFAKFEGLMISRDSSTKKIQVGVPHLPSEKIIRLTPHIHNDFKEIEFAVQFLKESKV